ncbi:hypothetical protein Hsw_3683 [Hymenobacter swuensis DY53]|uniref:Uncharacterized protein n=1 Tax=Hymenobacter swuensis DY53 TaxID=1227739 RepID=W8F2V8_9BACT|nr:hypothetical protein Hsw_3683 [Hymenobacter swuensis DY53]
MPAGKFIADFNPHRWPAFRAASFDLRFSQTQHEKTAPL